MNAKQLFHEGGKPTNVWHCTRCGTIHGPTMYGRPSSEVSPICQEMAEKCCRPTLCECGKEVRKHYTHCEECLQNRQWERELACFEKAEKFQIGEWDDPVFTRGDNYFHSVDDYLDQREETEETWVYCSTPVKFSPDPANMIEQALDGFYEDAADDIPTEMMKELEAFVDAWAERVNLRAWEIDTTRVVVIPARLGGAS